MGVLHFYGDPVLRKKAEPVTVFDDALRAFVVEMKDDMYEFDGVGLAAPQVGRSICLYVIDTTGGEQDPLVFINPEITWRSEETEDSDEGCLSVPDITMKVNRPSSVSVKAFNERGQEFVIENATGLLARAIQHEGDHLEGVLFVDRAGFAQRKMLEGKLKKMAKANRG